MDKIITSNDNRIYKKCIQLSQRKYRDKYGEYLIEGDKVVSEAIKSARVALLIISKEYKKKINITGIETVFMKGNLFKKIAQTETTQGIMAVVKKPNITGEIFLKSISEENGNVLVLDRLQDPGNIGTIIRTAEAAGYKGILLIKGTADVYEGKVIRSAAGSILRMPIFNVENQDECVKFLEKAGKKIIGTSLETSKYFYEEDLTRNIALVIGNEGNGISPQLLEKVHGKIKIPMGGEIESLNAAVAAAILMYQSVKKG